MGNCWRMPEDHLNLLPAPPTTHYTPLAISPIPISSDISIPKLVTVTRSSGNISQPVTDLHQIKVAQCRNLVAHLPLLNYDETKIKQTECAICLIDFLPHEQVRQLPCHGAHVFHPSCIDGWLGKSLTCPHCSSNVDATILLKFIRSSDHDDD